MAKEIPGFYYDAEKNRYFPIKGPIPGSGSSHPPKPEPTKAIHSRRGARVRTSLLLQGRELYGNVISSNNGKCNFEEEFRKTQASRPKVWRYSGTDKLVDSGLERLHVNLQTPEGETRANVLLTASRRGLSIFEVEKSECRSGFTLQSVSECVWPVGNGSQNECKFTPETIWTDLRTVPFLSSISSIKTCRKSPPAGVEDDGNIQSALVTTLGNERESGSVYLVDLAELVMEVYPTSLLRPQRVGTLHSTIWTADCGSNNKAVVGTDSGAALVDLVTNDKSWVLRSKSDVLAVQFVQSGNNILCGLRNGATITVDIREKQGSSASLERHAKVTRHKMLYPSSYNRAGKSSKRWFEVFGNILPSQTINLPSSITSFVSLQFDDQYFLASSMDGSIRLYDHRLAEKGPVQSYEGNVNSHTQIQLGVDPSEKFVMSGGEDACLRIWSIKSGELLFQDKFSDTVLSSVCWRGEIKTKRRSGLLSETNERKSARDYFDEERYGGAWLGSQEGLFYVQF